MEESLKAGEENKADALGRVKTTYPSGATYSMFKSDGSGIVFYPNGSPAVNVTAGDGIPPGLYTTLFANKGKRDVLGSWDCLGVGSCLFPKGRVRLCTTMQGGSEYSEDGDLLRSWHWDKRPLNEPIVLQLSDEFILTVQDRTNIRVVFRCMERQTKFEVGKVMRRKDTYLDKFETFAGQVTGVGTGIERGKLTLDVQQTDEDLEIDGALGSAAGIRSP